MSITIEAKDTHRSDQDFPEFHWVIFVSIWLLMAITFSASFVGDFSGGLEWAIEKLKIGSRLVVLALLGVSLLVTRRHPVRRELLVLVRPLCLFAIWAILSSLWSPLKVVTLGQAGTLATLLALALVIATSWKDHRDTSRFLFSVSTALLCLSVLLLIAKICFPGSSSLTRDGEGLGHSTNSSAVASLGLLIPLACSCLWRWRWAMQLLFVGCCIHGAVLLLASNRMSLVITLTLASLTILLYGNRGLLGLLAVAASLSGTCYLLLDPGFESVDTVGSFLERGQSGEELGSLSGRHEMWTKMWHSFSESPWIGHGYFVSSSTGNIEVWYEEGNWTAHNTMLQCLVSTGIVGSALLVWGLTKVFFSLLTSSIRSPDDVLFKHFLTLMALRYVVWGLMNESFLGPLQPESVVFFALLGITAAQITRSTSTKSTVEPLVAPSGTPNSWEMSTA